MIYNNYDEQTSTMTDSTCAEGMLSKDFVDYVKELSRTWTGFKDTNPFDWEFDADKKVSYKKVAYIPYIPREVYYSSIYSRKDSPLMNQWGIAKLDDTKHEDLNACCDDIDSMLEEFNK